MDVIELAMNNLKKKGVRKEDTMEYLIDQGRTTHKGPLTDEERERLRKNKITRHSPATHSEVTRIYLKHFAKKSVSGLDGEKLGEILVECHDNQLPPQNKCPKLIEKEMGVDKKTAKQIAYVVTKQAGLFRNWTFAKERKSNYFSISCPDNDKYDGEEFPIEDFPKYVGFMVENYGSPTFHRRGEDVDELRKKIKIKKG